ncbi:Serpentine receptor class r-10 [Caenorhabditis elegans]|uniref:Serpentine receptor class r-10 n=1 Tax=Caenorhabditis elegans TaxID=6239 RepID=G4SBH9_CAEEL|nr:Seven TM Receptor [Caenorhabditis elegans]CCD68702.1 Seven TM Receptor [Caenorhabditis elegans]|eukprot:NP_500671.2 Seven TM Receptor [Caenorhabditis elegans]
MGIFVIIKLIVKDSCTLIAILTNSLLIYLALTKSPPKMGNYKYLLCYFSVLSITYVTLDFLAAPYVYTFEASSVLLMDLRNTIFTEYPAVAFLIIVSACGCFGATLAAIAINFIYRLWALERKGRLRYFEGKLLIAWILLSLFTGFLSACVFWTTGPNDQINNYIRHNLKEEYDLDVDQTSYIAFVYWKSENRVDYLNILDTSKLMIVNIIMIIPFSIIFYCGLKSYYQIKELISKGENEFSRRLQMQLYKALVAQTFIPTLFLFIPVSLFLVGPLIGINVTWALRAVTVFFSIYLATESLPIIFLVDDYRTAIANIFRRCLSKPQVATVSVHDSD